MDTLVCLSKEMSPPLYASGNGANFLQLKTEIEATVLTHFTLVYFRLSPHTRSRAQREERPPELGSQGRHVGVEAGFAVPPAPYLASGRFY